LDSIMLGCIRSGSAHTRAASMTLMFVSLYTMSNSVQLDN
jgi:hypothetical protein